MPTKKQLLEQYLSIASDLAEELGDEHKSEVLRGLIKGPRMIPLYQKLAAIQDALNTSEERGNQKWVDRHSEHLEKTMVEYLPSGAGIDAPITMVGGKTMLRFEVPYHHMDENGMYWGWITYVVSITPSLPSKFDIEIEPLGEDLNLDAAYEDGIDVEGTMDYLADTMYEALNRLVPER